MNRYALLFLLPLCGAALATPPEQAPLTGRMLGTTAGPADAVSATDAPQALPAHGRSHPRDQGDVGRATRSLLQLQASGAAAAPLRPILGDQADASYRRYLRSFDHDIPVFFEATVGDDTATGAN